MKLAVLNTVTCIFYVKYKQMYFDVIVLFMVFLLVSRGIFNQFSFNDISKLSSHWRHREFLYHCRIICFSKILFLNIHKKI